MKLPFEGSRITRRELLAGATAGVAISMTHSSAAESAVGMKAAASSTYRNCDAPLHDLKGKVAFITGGSSGIGLGIAQACIQSGMKVVITYRSKEHLETALATISKNRELVHAIQLDVTDAPALHRAAEESVAVFGKVHLLVNNAGVQDRSSLSAIRREDWDRLMSVNVGGVLNSVQAFLPYLTKHGEGAHVATTSSIMGLFTLGGGYAAYCASKFAVVAMMETLRAELSDARVGVSVLCPGLVKSNLEEGLADHAAASEPVEVGKCLLEGVRRNQLYVLSHPEFERVIHKRFDLIDHSINKNLSIPAPRQTLAESALAASLYVRELARDGC